LIIINKLPLFYHRKKEELR